MARAAPRPPERIERLPRTAARHVVRSGAQPVWRSAIVPVVLGICALALRLFRIDHESLWLDEGYTLLFSHLPLDRLVTVGGAHEHPPLYYLIVHAVSALHDSYLVPRIVSAVAGSITVFVVYLLGKQVYGAAAGLIAALLTAVSPFHLGYSQDGRGYELAGLFVVLSYYFAVRALERRSRSAWLLYALSLALCLYGEYTTIFAVLPQALLLLRARRTRQTRGILAAWGAAALVFLPWIGVLALDATGVAADYWIPGPSVNAVSSTVLDFVGLMTPCPSPPCTGTELGVPFLAGNEPIVAMTLALMAIAGVAWVSVRRDLTSTILFMWLILPFAIVLLMAVRRSLYLDRVFLDATFPLYLLLGAWGAGIERRMSVSSVAGATAALLVLSGSVANLGPVYADSVNPDWKSAARDLAAAYRPGQAVIFNPGVLRTLLGAYLPARWHPTLERPLWSRAYLDVPGWQKLYPTSVTADKTERAREEAVLRDVQFRQATRGRRQVWLVTYDYPGMNDSRRWLTDHGFQNVLSEIYAGDTRIELWDRRSPAYFGPVVLPDVGFSSWSRSGNIKLYGPVAVANGATVLSRSFSVSPGTTYAASVENLGLPPASKPVITVAVYDRAGHELGLFPRTQWYDWPVNGVWLSQPFGFVAPPGASRATISLGTAWGESFWRHVAVYRER